ncbi:MAG: hypothetical protein GY939_02060 [Actinomycetia bacterium]|nr:hypothetical protein [Actinomycetes bacterium]
MPSHGLIHRLGPHVDIANKAGERTNQPAPVLAVEVLERPSRCHHYLQAWQRSKCGVDRKESSSPCD